MELNLIISRSLNEHVRVRIGDIEQLSQFLNEQVDGDKLIISMLEKQQTTIDSLTKIEWLTQLIWIFSDNAFNFNLQRSNNTFEFSRILIECFGKISHIRSSLLTLIGNENAMILYVSSLINDFSRTLKNEHSIPLFLNIIYGSEESPIIRNLILKSITLGISLSNKTFLENTSQFIHSKQLEASFALELFRSHVVQNIDEFSTSFEFSFSLSKHVPSLAFILFQSLLNWISPDLKQFSKLPNELKGTELVLIDFLCNFGSDLVSNIIEQQLCLFSSLEFLISLPSTKFNSIQSISVSSLRFYEKLLATIFDKSQHSTTTTIVPLNSFLSKASIANGFVGSVDRFVECTQILYSHSQVSENDKKLIISTLSSLQPQTQTRDEVLKYWNSKK